jgi:hypothetical protein
MATFEVYMQTVVSVRTDAADAEAAARYARDRIMGVLRELPSEFIAIGFEPDFHWQVRAVDGRMLGAIVMTGDDNILEPRPAYRPDRVKEVHRSE